MQDSSFLEQKTPKALVFQDIVGIGRCSMTVVLPILATFGVETCPIPTSVLSAHFGYPNPCQTVMTGSMRATVDRYIDEKIRFDACYSGFIGEEIQAEIICDLFSDQKALCLVDPVMGDHGSLYRSMQPGMIQAMRKLVSHADIITPNLTEAALLLGEQPVKELSQEQEGQWLCRLQESGPKSVIITSCTRKGESGIGIAVLHKDKRFRISSPMLPSNFPGTGDIFASVLLGSILSGMQLPQAATKAAGFVYDTMQDTIVAKTKPIEGVLLERNLFRLSNIVPSDCIVMEEIV